MPNCLVPTLANVYSLHTLTKVLDGVCPIAPDPPTIIAGALVIDHLSLHMANHTI